jgi:hypothetical protein
VCDVQITTDGEGGDDLAAGLLDGGELDARPGGDLESDLFTELALGGSPWIFVIGVLALGDRPRALVLARPERSTGVADQHFGDIVDDAVQQETGAAFRHPLSLGARPGRDQQGVPAHGDTCGADVRGEPVPQLTGLLGG